MRSKLFLTFSAIFYLYLTSQPIGSYNTFTGMITCYDKITCLHESAHKYDHEHSISKSNEWIEAVEDYRSSIDETIEYQDNPKDFMIYYFPGIGSKRLTLNNITTTSFFEGGWGGYTELYAWIAERSDGKIENIPQPFQGFYDLNSLEFDGIAN